MTKNIFLLLLLAFPVLLKAQHRVKLIPQPASLIEKEGSFLLDRQTALIYDPANQDLKAAALFLNEYLKNIAGFTLPVKSKAPRQIRLVISAKLIPNPEGYTLRVTPSAIEITAAQKAGLIYGLQSLFQTLPAIRTNAILNIPCFEVADAPRFAWRGMHLDVSRHFFSPELIKSYINLMATYKMNRFHWHLVDDQGWRIEIKKYPNLTQTGAWRVDHTDKVWADRPQAKPGERADYGGFYTQEQLKDIVAYAAQRNVTIVPEIEMPGHVASAIAAYPALSCTQKPQLPLTGGNYTNMSSNYCAGNDSVFNFLQDVLQEVMAIFPSPYIHVGGDEVDKTPWKTCAKCQERIRREGLKNEDELQSYFIRRIERFLVAKHRKMIGWDEILEGGLAPEATVMSWRGESGGIEAAKMHHDVVMTPGSPCYFDHYQAGPEGEPMAIGGMNTLRKVYSYEPIPKELNADEAKYVLGAQANLWTEYVTTAEHVEYMVLPRMLALSEVLWSPKEIRNWEDFNDRLKPQFKAFDQRGLHYSKGNFKVEIKPLSQNGQLKLVLSTEIVGATIFYTTNGTEPNTLSTKYTEPITVDASQTIKAVTVVAGKVMGAKPAEQSFVMHKAIGRAVNYLNPVSRYYLADGPNSLTDGVRGTGAVGKYWHAFSGQDLVATIDLGEEKQVKSLTLGCLQHYRDWIFLPQSVKFEGSTDGITFREIDLVNNSVPPTEQALVIKDFKTVFAPQPLRFIRVSAKVVSGCPKGHPGEGKPGWIFADEIIVE